MHIEFYEQQTLTLLRDLQVSSFTFNIQEQEFLLAAGYSPTPVQARALPVEFMVSDSGIRMFFKSGIDAEDFIKELQEAIVETERRRQSMTD